MTQYSINLSINNRKYIIKEISYNNKNVINKNIISKKFMSYINNTILIIQQKLIIITLEHLSIV